MLSTNDSDSLNAEDKIHRYVVDTDIHHPSHALFLPFRAVSRHTVINMTHCELV